MCVGGGGVGGGGCCTVAFNASPIDNALWRRLLTYSIFQKTHLYTSILYLEFARTVNVPTRSHCAGLYCTGSLYGQVYKRVEEERNFHAVWLSSDDNGTKRF